MSHPMFMVLNPIFCYVSPKIVIFHELLIIETHNKCHWIWPASFSIVTLQLTICMQLKCSFSITVIFNCHHFATDHLHTVKMLIFYHHHFQLLSLCNWPSSGVGPVYNIPSVGVKSSSSVLWSSANFWSISQNMHYKAPVASQHWKTNKVVWTWKDDQPPWRMSTYKRPFTWEGNYLVNLVEEWVFILGRETYYSLVWNRSNK